MEQFFDAKVTPFSYILKSRVFFLPTPFFPSTLPCLICCSSRNLSLDEICPLEEVFFILTMLMNLLLGPIPLSTPSLAILWIHGIFNIRLYNQTQVSWYNLSIQLTSIHSMHTVTPTTHSTAQTLVWSEDFYPYFDFFIWIYLSIYYEPRYLYSCTCSNCFQVSVRIRFMFGFLLIFTPSKSRLAISNKICRSSSHSAIMDVSSANLRLLKFLHRSHVHLFILVLSET